MLTPRPQQFRSLDIAAVAVAALTEGGHEGKSYDTTGPEALTHGQMAEELFDTLGKPVAFENISGEAMREALLSFHMPEWQADGLVEDYEHYSRGEATTLSTAVEDVTGIKPRISIRSRGTSRKRFSARRVVEDEVTFTEDK